MFFIRFVVLLFWVAYSWSMGQFPTSELNEFGRIVSLSFFLALPALYFLPTFEAWKKSHPNLTAISLVNLFLGWSLLGWVVAVVWAFKRTEHVSNSETPKFDTKKCPFCAEEILVAAIKCKHCGSELPETPQTSD
ncbi:superinfection immunity protein [Azonexus sp.]|uniref:superinfection immunity protein n=1 Tax=Azonexus sp. TaxID=1872668 RepID=UPI0035B3B46F